MGTARVQHLVSFAVFDKEMVAARVEIVCVYTAPVLLRGWHREGSDTRHQIPDHIPCFEFGLDKAVVLALESGIPVDVAKVQGKDTAILFHRRVEGRVGLACNARHRAACDPICKHLH